MSFNDYWKAKAAKRRKAWAAKAKRFAEKHMQLEDIRSELFFSYVKREELLSLWNEHRTVQNPIARVCEIKKRSYIYYGNSNKQ